MMPHFGDTNLKPHEIYYIPGDEIKHPQKTEKQKQQLLKTALDKWKAQV